jgi:hypothetical protein
MAPSTLSGLVEGPLAARATLAGPATGCPFLLDAAKNPIFSGLGMTPDTAQTKGCTFCLDNTGSYAAVSEDAVVGTWLARLRDLREHSPNLGEVLLVDERPHPYLPGFFRALIADRQKPLELLFKSRVDWLLEFADGPVAEAAALAAEHQSVLHLYLVGFESFDQFHLDLFNKGVSVAHNVAAIEKMRELGERFPCSFEYRRHRAHGIVLFTPWTTPEHLIENARHMRRVRFHELRSEAVRTRLRLYPRTPLHALAERDGLLAPSFEPGRPDRATEQGYDASVAWRFRDARMEAAFQAASDLRACALVDADLIELAARLLTRYPGLGAVPEVASLPLREALRSWGALGASGPARVDAALLGIDTEIELVAHGAKRACLKEAVLRADADALCRAYRAMGFAAETVAIYGLTPSHDRHERGVEYATVAVARDQAAREEVLAAQAANANNPGGAAAEAVGALMGYPSCCVQAFLRQPARGDNLENERLTFRRGTEQELDPLLHRVGSVRVLSHHPCTPSCAASIALGERILELLAAIDAPATARARQRMERPVLFLDYRQRLELAGAWEGDRFRVDEAEVLDHPQDFPIDATTIAAIELSTDGACFTLRDGSRVEIRASFPLLTNPGGVLAPMARSALGPLTEAKPRERAPALPSSFRAGVRVHDYRIVSIGPRGDAHEILLGKGDHRFLVRVRGHDPARPYVIRRGGWAIDVERPEGLPAPARVALGVLVRALPGT